MRKPLRSRIAGPDANGWYSLQRRPTAEAIRALRSVGHLGKFSITKAALIDASAARVLSELPPVDWLWLWCPVTRAAIRRVLKIPGLRTLDVLQLHGPGRLRGFEAATQLRTLRMNHAPTAKDLKAIARCVSLRELGIQSAELTPAALNALLALPHLESLDLEGTAFDDAMAERLSGSTMLRHLEIGATRLTRLGLEHLSAMPQLRGLDVWATPLQEDDFELLQRMPALEYLSVVGSPSSDGYPPSLDAARLVPLLLSLPALKRLWLDGVRLAPEQTAALKSKLDSVQIT
jgi:hypothetical protein